MAQNITCSNCGLLIEEDSNNSQPCPNCGSLLRTANITAVSIGSSEAFGSPSVVVQSDLEVSFTAIAGLFLTSIVEPGEKTPHGLIIKAVTLPWFEIIKLLEKDPSAAFQIPPRKWEEIIAGAYTKAGFDEVILTPSSGDHGRDVIAVKKGIGKIRVIDQVKAYKPGHLVAADDVRALIGVLHGDQASKAFLTTTSDFAPKLKDDPLIMPFIPSRLELVNGDLLLQRLQELGKNNTDLDSIPSTLYTHVWPQSARVR